jgi:hypothetical protein
MQDRIDSASSLALRARLRRVCLAPLGLQDLRIERDFSEGGRCTGKARHVRMMGGKFGAARRVGGDRNVAAPWAPAGADIYSQGRGG